MHPEGDLTSENPALKSPASVSVRRRGWFFPARPGRWPRRWGWALADLVRTGMERDQDRLPLWLPVCMGLGIAVYFSCPAEPPPWVAVAAVLLALGGTLAAFRTRLAAHAAPGRIMAALLAFSVGFAGAQARTGWVAGPILLRATGPVGVSGRVANIERLDRGVRVTLADPAIVRVAEVDTPRLVRIRLKPKDAAPLAGSRIRLLAELGPPPEAAEPGAYDFRRTAYFLGIGAVGFALKSPEVVTEPPPPVDAWSRASDWVVGLRERIAARVLARLSGARAAIAIALLNGEQTGIPPADMQAMRVSGLQHILSISGLHISLVAAIFYGVARTAFALWPWLALHHPIKKYAALFGIAATFIYMSLVGPQVPTLRSVLMVTLAMVAVLTDRSVFSLRGLAIAGMICLLYQPEQLTGPSFQMSFGSVLALISAYEVLRGPLAAWRGEGWLRRAVTVPLALCLTSIISTLATLPFGLYHFQQVANYGLFSNLIGIPITELWIMPLCLVAYVLMPLGLDGWVIDLIGWGCEGILWTARTTAALPGATLHGAALSTASFALIVTGGLWLTLWYAPWRLLGLLPVLAGVGLVPWTPRPDVLIAADSPAFAVRGGDGALRVSTARGGGFAADTWGKRDGEAGRPAVWSAGDGPDSRLRCDGEGCVYAGGPAGRVLVAFPRTRAALTDDCERATVVVSRLPLGECPVRLGIGPDDLREKGAHALYLDGNGGIRVETVRDRPHQRPWS